MFLCHIQVLNRTRIVSGIRQGINASVAQHMRVDRECHSGTLAEARKFSGVVTAANHASWMEGEVIAYSSTPTVSVSMV